MGSEIVYPHGHRAGRSLLHLEPLGRRRQETQGLSGRRYRREQGRGRQQTHGRGQTNPLQPTPSVTNGTGGGTRPFATAELPRREPAPPTPLQHARQNRSRPRSRPRVLAIAAPPRWKRSPPSSFHASRIARLTRWGWQSGHGQLCSKRARGGGTNQEAPRRRYSGKNASREPLTLT